MKRSVYTGGFTLVELLIVVSIIAILAGIALPNFLDAQIRSKVSRVKSDQRTVAVALEAYAVDNKRYPPSTLVPPPRRLRPLTSPIAYITTTPVDIFRPEGAGHGPGGPMNTFEYGAMPIDRESRWALTSVGPDRQSNDGGQIEFYPGYSNGIWENPASGYTYIRYDPTNGTVSVGDVWRVSDHTVE